MSDQGKFSHAFIEIQVFKKNKSFSLVPQYSLSCFVCPMSKLAQPRHSMEMHACHLRVCYFDCRSKGISKTLQYPDKSEGRNIIITTVGKSSFSFYIMSCHRNPHAYFSLNFSHTHFGISIEHPPRSSVVIEALLAKLTSFLLLSQSSRTTVFSQCVRLYRERRNNL